MSVAGQYQFEGIQEQVTHSCHSTQFNILAIEQQEGFYSLESTIQKFCSQQVDIRKQELDLVLQDIQDGSHKITTSIQAMQLTTGDEKQYDRLLSSLMFPSMNARKNQISLAHTDTCEWIFGISPDSDDESGDPGDHKVGIGCYEDDNYDGDHSGKLSGPLWDDFGDWLRRSNNIYWISGKAGSGKSTLMKLLHDHKLTTDLLKQWAMPQDVLCLEAYLWDAGSEAQKSLRGLIATLLAQILQHLPYLGRSLLKDQPTLQQKSQFEDWSAKELQKCLFFVFWNVEQKFCLFIDGLDEGRATHSEPQDTIINFIVALSAFESVKSCVSSRPLRVYEGTFCGYPKLRLEDLNSNDIEKVYRDRLGPSIREAYTVTDAEIYHLQNQFKEKANGVFLWAYLAIESLRQGIQNLDSFKVLRKRLEVLPSELNDLYEDMWKRQNDADRTLYREEASRFLRLCLIDDSPYMNHSLLQYTLALPQSENLRAAAMAGQVHDELVKACECTQIHIRTRCAGMLEITPHSSPDFSKHLPLKNKGEKLDNMRFTNVQFIHRTAKDFLVTTPFGQEISASRCTDVELAHSLFRARLCEMSMSSQPFQLELLQAVLRSVSYMAKCDQLTILRATEDVCVDNFTRTNQGSENAGDWFICAKKDEVLRRYYEGSSYYLTSLDFLAFTIACYFCALAKHFLCTGSRKVNSAYSRYCLLSWNWRIFYDLDAARIMNLERQESYIGLLTALLQLSRPYQTGTMKQTFDDDSSNNFIFLEWTPNHAFRQSVPSHLCSEVLYGFPSRTSCISGSMNRKAAHVLCQFLALQTNLNDKTLYWLRVEPHHFMRRFSLDQERYISTHEYVQYHQSALPPTGLVVECNVYLLMSHWFERCVGFLEHDAFLEIRTSLSSANVEPSIRCLLAHCEGKSLETSFSTIQEEDSEYLIALLQDALPDLWFSGKSTTFTVSVSLWETISASIARVHGRGEPVGLFEYLKETGWVKDIDDPEVMRRPPPMYLDDEEIRPMSTALGKDDDGPASSTSSSDDDQEHDEFFDAEEEREGY